MKYSCAALFFVIIGVAASFEFLGNTRPTKKASLPLTPESNVPGWEVSRRKALASILVTSAVAALSPQAASARLESVNRPDLLPSQQGLNVIQTEKFLTGGQARRMDEMLTNLEKATGYRVRVLCQNYPNTPGLAIRDYWDLGKEVSKKWDEGSYLMPCIILNYFVVANSNRVKRTTNI
jgi:hypothetical protein